MHIIAFFILFFVFWQITLNSSLLKSEYLNISDRVNHFYSTDFNEKMCISPNTNPKDGLNQLQTLIFKIKPKSNSITASAKYSDPDLQCFQWSGLFCVFLHKHENNPGSYFPYINKNGFGFIIWCDIDFFFGRQ